MGAAKKKRDPGVEGPVKGVQMRTFLKANGRNSEQF